VKESTGDAQDIRSSVIAASLINITKFEHISKVSTLGSRFGAYIRNDIF
jgi:hypothetical protein